MTHEESMAEADRILREAGWHAHPDWGGHYARANLVGGIQPDKQGCHFKDYTKITAGHPLYGPDTPDEPHEAAAWLVAHCSGNTLVTAATLEPVRSVALDSHEDEESVSREGELSDDAAREAHGEDVGGDAPETAGTPEGDEALAGVEAGDELRADIAGGDENRLNTELALSERHEADFGELIEPEPELLGDADFEPLLIEGEAPELGAELEAEHPEMGAGAFIFGDNLGHDRIVRIGQLAEHAVALIEEAKRDYSESEHNAVRSHVVTNMNEAGMYVGGDQALFDRFIHLEGIVHHVRAVEAYRDARQDFIRTAGHDAVANFDPAEGWP